MDALAYAKEAGLTVVRVADSAFAAVAKVSDLLLPAAVGTGLAFDTACAPMLPAGCCWRRSATTCRTRRPGWSSSTRGRRRAGCSWSERR
ncbi:hypothetical protein TUSST3_37380 [Streptomyces sp. TUS-ST3]|nr:hypothetical protein TUSST3_37380 [Streptomyces sp. TUS-ST3]